MQIKNKAFTLVELMIVVVVLSILSVSGYLYYSEYKKTARDSVRKSNLLELENAVKYYHLENSIYPDPDNLSTGTTDDFKDSHGNLWGTGVFGENLVKKIKEIKRLVVDPKTGNPYSYDIMLEGKQNYRLKTVFEDTKDDYILANKITNGIVDGPYKNETTGYSFRYVKRRDSWSNLDTNCPLPDIEIVSSTGTVQTWAGCNSTLGEGLEWGRNKDGDKVNIDCYDYNDDIITIDIEKCKPVENISSNMYSGANPYSYFEDLNPSGVKSNGDREFNTIWGKLYDYYQADKENNACPSAWHLPSKQELSNLLSYLGCNSVVGDNKFYCKGVGWRRHNLTDYNPSTNIVSLLKIPLSGQRKTNKEDFIYRGNNSTLWTKERDNYHFVFYENGIKLKENMDENSGLSVRCIKD